MILSHLLTHKKENLKCFYKPHSKSLITTKDDFNYLLALEIIFPMASVFSVLHHNIPDSSAHKVSYKYANQ